MRNYGKLGHSVKAGEKRKSWQEVVRAVPRASANTHARANIPVIVQLHHQSGDLPDVPWNKYLISSRSNCQYSGLKNGSTRSIFFALVTTWNWTTWHLCRRWTIMSG